MKIEDAQYGVISPDWEETFFQDEEDSRHVRDNSAADHKPDALRQSAIHTIGEMVAFVAHELRNPLQNIQLAVDILRHKAPDENLLPETLDQIEYSVRLMSGVVKSFVEYSKPIRLEFEEVSLRDLVDQALRVTDAGLRGINVITALEQACPKITVDPKKLVQVLLNIILNAAEAMPEGGNLTISSSFTPSEGGNSLLLSFSDTGHGIDPKDIARIQEHFVTTKPHGIGLGIPICKKIIEAHGGSLEITSALGAGTTVLISLAVH